MMKLVKLLFVLALCLAVRSASAQAPCSGHASDSHAQDQSQKQSQQGDKGKNTKKDKEAGNDSSTFSEAAAKDVLQRLTDGFEGHNERLTLSAFDDKKMDGYLNFQDQIDAFFQRYDSFRVHFRIDQAMAEDDKGVALVDLEMEGTSSSGNVQPVRKQEQMRFEMERGKKGWKIVDLQPRSFFAS